MGVIDTLHAVIRPLAKSVPVVSLDNETDPGELRLSMRRILDHPVAKHLPFLALLVPAAACVLLWALTQIPGVAIAAALVLYAQLSALSSRHVITSIWATTTLAIRKALANGAMSKKDAGDRALVAQASKAFMVYGFALTILVPALNILVAIGVLWVTATSRGGVVPTTLLSVLLATVIFSAFLAFIPNRVFVRLANKILAKSQGSHR